MCCLHPPLRSKIWYELIITTHLKARVNWLKKKKPHSTLAFVSTALHNIPDKNCLFFLNGCFWVRLKRSEDLCKLKYGLGIWRSSLLSRTDALNSGGLCSLWVCAPLHPGDKKEEEKKKTAFVQLSQSLFRYQALVSPRLPVHFHPFTCSLAATHFCYDHLLL